VSDQQGSGRWLAAVTAVLALVGVAAGKACLHMGGFADNAVSSASRYGDSAVVHGDDFIPPPSRAEDAAASGPLPHGGVGSATARRENEWADAGRDLATDLSQEALEECVSQLDISELDENHRPKDPSVCAQLVKP